jgi:hypothetical protein
VPANTHEFVPCRGRDSGGLGIIEPIRNHRLGSRDLADLAWYKASHRFGERNESIAASSSLEPIDGVHCSALSWEPRIL